MNKKCQALIARLSFNTWEITPIKHALARNARCVTVSICHGEGFELSLLTASSIGRRHCPLLSLRWPTISILARLSLSMRVVKLIYPHRLHNNETVSFFVVYRERVSHSNTYANVCASSSLYVATRETKFNSEKVTRCQCESPKLLLPAWHRRLGPLVIGIFLVWKGQWTSLNKIRLSSNGAFARDSPDFHKSISHIKFLP